MGNFKYFRSCIVDVTGSQLVKVPRYSFSGSIPPKFVPIVAINRDFEKFLSQILLDKGENCYDQGCDDIGASL